MLSIAAAVWAGILAAGCALLYATADRLPARVASGILIAILGAAALSWQLLQRRRFRPPR